MKKCLKILSVIFFLSSSLNAFLPIYIATVSDELHFGMLQNLIGSLHKTNFDHIAQIAVFDIGMTAAQRAELERMHKVAVYNVELVNPYLCTYFRTCHSGRAVRGFYAWKPVLLKQSLEMFPYVLYMDAGTTVLKPLDDVFSHIVRNGYLLWDCGKDIAWQTTQYVVRKFNLNSPERRWILDPETVGVCAGVQGLSRKMFDSYVMPMYECARTDFRAFVDDGTTPNGFGTGRHDQALFSIYARLLGLTIFTPDNGDGHVFNLTTLEDTKVPLHVTWIPGQVNDNTLLWHSRGGGSWHLDFIRYK